ARVLDHPCLSRCVCRTHGASSPGQDPIPYRRGCATGGSAMSAIPVAGHASGTPERVFSAAKMRGAQRLDFTRDYLTALYRDAAERGINADVLVAQWDLETGCGTSAYWVRDGNPAGLAAFDDGSNWGLQFSPEKAA